MRLAVIALIGMVACVPEEEDNPISHIPKESSCGAQELQYLVGDPVDTFDFKALGIPVRILPPGAMRTMDYRLERLNVDLDKEDRITRIWCG